MNFPLSRAVVPGLEVIESVESTNDELGRRERAIRQPHFTVLATLDQTAGRGRLGRTWSAPPGAALAVSVLIRPEAIPAERLGLFTLLGGLAAHHAVATELVGGRVAVKWPNDVLVGDRKLVGVLAQVISETGAVVLGVGINTAMTPEQLPVPTATSIAIEQGRASDPDELADRVLATFLGVLADLIERFEAARGDIDRAGLREELEAACGTLGERVSVELPDGTFSRGQALGIGADGSLFVRMDGTDGPTAILAGDVTHLRYQ